MKVFKDLGTSCSFPGVPSRGEKNMDHIHALSMNYVDHSNYYLHLLNQLFEQHWRSFEIFTNGDFPQGLFSKQDHITYGEFKSTAWYEVRLIYFRAAHKLKAFE